MVILTISVTKITPILFTVWRIESPKNWQRDNLTKIDGNWVESLSLQVTVLFFFSETNDNVGQMSPNVFELHFVYDTNEVLLIFLVMRIISYYSLILISLRSQYCPPIQALSTCHVRLDPIQLIPIVQLLRYLCFLDFWYG